MPLYDYSCRVCEQTWEELQRINDRKIPESLPCPNCGSMEVEQTIVFTNLAVSHVSEHSRELKKLNRSAFAEKMNMIHHASPGSTMNQHSNIVDIK